MSYCSKRQRGEAGDDLIGMDLTMIALSAAVPIPQFIANIKELYSDFIVREIPSTCDNSPLFLTDLGSVDKSINDDAHTPDSQSPDNLNTLILEAFEPLLGKEETEMIINLSDQNQSSLVFQPIPDKSVRSKVHQEIKRLLGDRYISTTEEGKIKVIKATGAEKRAQDKRSNAGKPQKFLHFTLYKENTDSLCALRHISTTLGISARSLQFSGTKDKRAVTIQRVACKGLSRTRLLRVNQVSIGRNGVVKVGSFEEKDCGLSLGDLGGNHFTITLRLIEDDDIKRFLSSCGEGILKTIKETLRQKGFINYFGPQRFGTTSILTSDIGRLLLSGNFKEGIHLILSSRVEISPEGENMLNCFDGEGGPEAALSCCPHYFFMERDILRHLVKCPNDYKGAFTVISRPTAMLYFHAVQSLIWNQWTSRRLSRSPHSPMAGDLVLASHQSVPIVDEEVETESGTPHLPVLHIVTANDVIEGRYTIHDVLMTVPGSDPNLQYPSIEKFMTKESLLEDLSKKGFGGLVEDGPLAKQFHFHGTYRKICVSVPDFEAEIRRITSLSKVVEKTDLEVLYERKREDKVGQEKESPQSKIMSIESADTPCAELAVVVKFSLPAGCYATSVLREFCKAKRGTQGPKHRD